MKKLLFTLTAVLVLVLVSCQEDVPPPSATPTSVTYYNPPSWAIGLWKDSVFVELGYPNSSKFEFTFNDVIITSANIQSSFNETFGDPILEEEYGNFYHVKLTGGYEYWFERVSNTRMYFYQQDPATVANPSIYKRY